MKIFSMRQLFVSSILILITVFVFSGCTRQIDQDSFRFVFMTDIHVQPEKRGDEGFRAAIAKVNKIRPEFVITGGDLIMDALRQKHERAAILFDMYTDISKDFEMPVYNTIGNHENFGLFIQSGVSPGHPEFGKEMFRQRIGNGGTYYSFNHKNWHFIILDDIGYTPDRKYYGNVDSLQLEWLKNDLANTDKETPIALSVHIPFVSIGQQMLDGGNAALPPNVAVGNSHKVLELFEEHNLRLVLQGHLHLVEEIIFNDVHFITGGAVCANWWEGPYNGMPEGFVVVDVKGNNFSWEYQTYGWEASVPEEEKYKQ